MQETCLMLSDLHMDEIVDEEEMEKYNKYNFDIACNRLYFLINEVIRMTNMFRQNYYIDKCNVSFLGDNIGGVIHEELIETNEFPVIESVLMVALVLSQAMAMLLANYKTVEISAIVGNHGRLGKKYYYKKHYNNFDYLIYQVMSIMLSQYIESGRLIFNIPKSPAYIITRMGHNILLTHGNMIPLRV
jgi:hypothetical protein